MPDSPTPFTCRAASPPGSIRSIRPFPRTDSTGRTGTMDEMVSLFLTGQREFSARVNEIADDQWRLPTVDTAWDVAALVDHLIDEQRWLGPLIGGQSLAEAGETVKAMGPTEPD